MSSTPTVTMNVMMAIHCKKTVSVDLRRPLKEYIRKYFSDRDMKDSEDDLQVNRLTYLSLTTQVTSSTPQTSTCTELYEVNKRALLAR